MVEYTLQLDNIFGSLADATRRDILKQVSKRELSVGQIAKRYKLTFAAISKHLKIMEKAKLIIKRRKGKQQMVQLAPKTLARADDCLQNYQRIWNERFDRLDKLLEIEKSKLNK